MSLSLSLSLSWFSLFHFGDLALTLPTGAAIAAWLLAARAWRAAVGWMLAFGMALALVAATKIAFLGWATGLPALDFKAVSGHAAGYTATFPTLCWLLTQRAPPMLRYGATGAALALGMVVVAALIHTGEHTPAEAVAGWLVGAVACACAAYLGAGTPAPPAAIALPSAALAFGITAWVLHSVSVGYWMVKVALALSGNHYPYSWDRCG
jgi:hypothetical protein